MQTRHPGRGIGRSQHHVDAFVCMEESDDHTVSKLPDAMYAVLRLKDAARGPVELGKQRERCCCEAQADASGSDSNNCHNHGSIALKSCEKTFIADHGASTHPRTLHTHRSCGPAFALAASTRRFYRGDDALRGTTSTIDGQKRHGPDTANRGRVRKQR